MAIAKNQPAKTPEKTPKELYKQAFETTWIQFSSTTSIHGEIYKL